MKSIKHFVVLAFATLTFFAVPGHAITIIYQDDFSGTNNTNLLGTAPDIRPSTQTWSGSTLAFDADGSVDNEGNRGAWLPFVPTVGNVYLLSGTINTTTGSWITLGFAERNPDNNFNSTTPTGADPYGTALVNTSGGVTFFVGEGLLGSSNHAGIIGANLLDIVLDTRNANSALWTMAFSLNGTRVVGPTTVQDGGVFTGVGNFNTIGYVGFSVAGATGQIDNFSLSNIPEPTVTSFFGIGWIAILLRRQRN